MTSHRKLWCMLATLLFYCSVSTTMAQWVQTNGPAGGWISALAVAESGTVFAGTSTEGVFKSTDRGMTWVAVNNGLPGIEISALACVGNHLTVYGIQGGKYLSVDEGDHWAQAEEPGPDYQTFGVTVSNDGEIYAEGYWDFSHSTDSGNTWSSIAELFADLSPMVALRDGIIIKKSPDRDGVIRSTDHGKNWSETDTTPGSVCSFVKNKTNEIFAVSGKGTFHSTDDGISWSQTGTTGFTSTSAMAINSAGDLFVGTSAGIFRSTDSGANWLPVNSGLANTRIRCCVVNENGDIYTGTHGGGIFISTDNGTSWHSPRSGLAATPVYCLAVNESGNIFAGTHASGVFRYSNSDTVWTRLTSGLPVNSIGDRIAAAKNAPDVYTATDSGLYVSVDDGESWLPANSDLSTDNGANALIVDEQGNIIAATDEGIVHSSDRGVSWITSAAPSRVWSLAADGNGTIYAGARDGVFSSAHLGSEWKRISDGLPAECTIISIAVIGPLNLLAVTDYDGTFLSIDGGSHWGKVNDSLSFGHSIMNDGDGNLFACSSRGVFISTDGGVNWHIDNTGLPEASVYSLVIADGQLYAGTDNCGVWRRPLHEMVGIQHEKIPLKNFGNRGSISISGQMGMPVTVSFTLVQPEFIRCSVYSLTGRRMAILADNRFVPGEYHLSWNPRNKATGCYVVKTRIGTVSFEKRINVLR